MTTPAPKRLKAIKPPAADEPAPFDPAQAEAIQAMIDGRASEHQQRIGMQWIINSASMAHLPAYRATDRDTNFALGRAFVGQQILGLAKVNLIKFAGETPTRERK